MGNIDIIADIKRHPTIQICEAIYNCIVANVYVIAGNETAGTNARIMPKPHAAKAAEEPVADAVRHPVHEQMVR